MKAIKKILSIFSIFLVFVFYAPNPVYAAGAITLDSYTNTNGGGLNNPTSSVTVAVGATGLLVAVTAQGDTPSAVTYNAVSMTSMGSASLSNGYNHSAWYMANPASGTHNVLVTITSASNPTQISTWSLFGAQTSTIADATANGVCSVNCTNESFTITTVGANAWVFATWSQNVGAGTFGFGGSVAGTSRTSSGYGAADSNGGTSSGAHTVAASYTTSNRIGGFAVSLIPQPVFYNTAVVVKILNGAKVILNNGIRVILNQQ